MVLLRGAASSLAAPTRLRLGAGLLLAPTLSAAVANVVDGPALEPVLLGAIVLSTLVGGIVPGVLGALVTAWLLRHKVSGHAGVEALLLVGIGVLVPALIRHSRSATRRLRTQAEVARRQSAAASEAEIRYRALVETLPVGIYIDEANPQASNLYSSPQIEAMFGYSAEQWLTDPDFLSKVVHPEDRDRLRNEIVAAIECGGGYDSEYRVVAKDGRVVWVQDAAVVVEDETGKPLYVQGYLADITEQRRAVEKLRESEARYRSLVENLPIATYVDDVGPAGRTRYVSPQLERMLGYSAEEWLSDPDMFLNVLHADDQDTMVVDRQEAGGETDSRHEFRVVARDGTVYWVESHRVVVHDDEGTPLFTQGFWFDMTERRRLEEQLRSAQRLEAVGQVAGGIAHDFNNLLTAISGYAGFALEHPAVRADDRLRREIGEVVRAADRASTLTRQLLAFGRRQVLAPKVIALNEVVVDLVRMFDRVIGDHISIEFDLDPELAHVVADPVQFEQVLANLALNARDAMPEGGTLTIATSNTVLEDAELDGVPKRVSGSFVLLRVRDDGCGMDDATRERIFEPFFTTKRIGEGTGLGLPTVYGIVQQSGGFITAASRVGAGTEISIYLPQTERALDRERPAERVDVPTGVERILLVEDEDTVRGLVREMLEGLGYAVVEAATGEHALAELDRDEHFDLLLTDVLMPGMTGRELAERVTRARPQVAVVYTSGYAANVLDDDSVEPDDSFLQKPFTTAELAVRVRRALDLKSARV